MTNPYLPPKAKVERVFKTPIIVPLSVLMVILIFVGYTIFHVSGGELGLGRQLVSISFEVFLLCEFGLLFIFLYNKSQLEPFLKQHPMIGSWESLEALKPVARTNMYSALLMILFMALGSLTAIMTVLNEGLFKSVVAAILAIIASVVGSRYNPVEIRVKQIRCNDEALNAELERILNCWTQKILPNF